MSGRRAPIETADTSIVMYPSALFSLERDEVYPYERFAYNILAIAVEALHIRKLPQHLTVDFTHQGQSDPAWLINASISFELDSSGTPRAFQFRTPELAPAILYMFAATIASDFFDSEGFEEFQKTPIALRDRIQFLFDGVSIGVLKYRDGGFGSGIRAAYDHLGLTIATLQKCANDYDLLAMQMAFHEVAHAYVEQITRKPTATALESTAFEFIADLVATHWFYNKMIVNTPDNEEYRGFRGVNSHAEAIFLNSLLALQSQQALLILMALAGAQRTGGTVSLAAGPIHPAGMQRYLLQHLLLYTLIASNFGKLLSEQHLRDLQNDWDKKIDTLVQAGILPRIDLERMLDVSEYDAVELSANLIEELKVPELQKMLPTLRSIRESLSETIERRRKKRN